ncbi:hypothetical protein D9758_004479 [Tetrapyrgos nigripes]|uniref:Uncharacterized protein n=1 Tax=Tetrapyrgos nigripes TaxID=182062 RepID=A0A8H5GNA3_9AGAR|nr:hypothetical protein D9758_004479 [Tetrapyrgos nigripes]
MNSVGSYHTGGQGSHATVNKSGEEKEDSEEDIPLCHIVRTITLPVKVKDTLEKPPTPTSRSLDSGDGAGAQIRETRSKTQSEEIEKPKALKGRKNASRATGQTRITRQTTDRISISTTTSRMKAGRDDDSKGEKEEADRTDWRRGKNSSFSDGSNEDEDEHLDQGGSIDECTDSGKGKGKAKETEVLELSEYRDLDALKQAFTREIRANKLSLEYVKKWLEEHPELPCSACLKAKRPCIPIQRGMTCMDCSRQGQPCSRKVWERQERIMRKLEISQSEYDQLLQWYKGHKKDHKDGNGDVGQELQTRDKKRKEREGEKRVEEDRKPASKKLKIPGGQNNSWRNLHSREKKILAEEDIQEEQSSSATLATGSKEPFPIPPPSAVSGNEEILVDLARRSLNDFIAGQINDYRALKALQRNLSSLADKAQNGEQYADGVIEDLSQYSRQVQMMQDYKSMMKSYVGFTAYSFISPENEESLHRSPAV